MSLSLEPPSCPFLSLNGTRILFSHRRTANTPAFPTDSLDHSPLHSALGFVALVVSFFFIQEV
jgi:hypothetical protein